VANIDASYEPSLQGLFQKSTVISPSGTKVGIVGYLTQETEFFSQTGEV
jgi:5'-nucleotidase